MHKQKYYIHNYVNEPNILLCQFCLPKWFKYIAGTSDILLGDFILKLATILL